MKRRAKGKRPPAEKQDLWTWAHTLPEAPVRRRELMAILSQLIGKPNEDEPEQSQEVEA